MQADSVTHYCLKCLAPNPLGQELCLRCGMRLMLTVEPAMSKYDDGGLGGQNEEHLLERVSAVEGRMDRFAEKFDRGLKALLEHASEPRYDPFLVEMVITSLSDAGFIPRHRADAILERRRLSVSENLAACHPVPETE